MLNKKKIKASILIKLKMGFKMVETTLIRNFAQVLLVNILCSWFKKSAKKRPGRRFRKGNLG